VNSACGSDLRKYVFALLDALGIRRFNAVGASIGGMTLLRMATLEPERTEAVVVIGVGTEIPAECGAILSSIDPEILTQDEWNRLRKVHHDGDRQIHDLYAWVASLADEPEDTTFPPAERAAS